MQLDGRVCVITGAGRGIGASLARTLAAQGARVVVNDLGSAVDGEGTDTAPAQQVVDEIRAAGGQAVANFGDVTDYDQAEALIQSALDEFGGLDVMINVAGILRDRMVFNMAEREWDDVIRVHLKGTFPCHPLRLHPLAPGAQGPLSPDQLHLRLRPLRRPRPAQLRRCQDGPRRFHPLLRQRPPALRRYRQRHLPRRPHPHGRRHPPGSTPRRLHRRTPRTTPAAPPTTSLYPSPTSPPRIPTGSAAASSVPAATRSNSSPTP